MDTSNPTSYWKNKEDLHTISVRIALAPPVRSRTNTRGVRARCTNRYTKGDGTGYWTRTNKCGVRVRRFTISLIPLAGVDGFEPSIQESKSWALPLRNTPIYTRHIFSVELPIVRYPKGEIVGLEPTTHSMCNLLYMSCGAE